MKRIIITLTESEVLEINEFKWVKRTQREMNRANVLLALNKRKSEKEISDFLNIDYKTVWRIKKRFLKGWLKNALQDKERSGQPKKYSEKQEAEVIALACSDSPEWRTRWSLELLTKEMQKRDWCKTINRETIRLILKKTNVNLGWKKCGVLLK